MRIVGLMLAAGSGQRFGGDKLLAPLADGPWRGTALGVVAARRLADTLPETIAIVRAEDTALAAALSAAGVRTVVCADASEGMGASLACGIAATADADGWVVALADMPWIAASTLGAVASALRHGAAIAAPVFRGQRGHPVGFAARHREALLALRGDAGARDLLREESATLVQLDVNDAGIVRDVDVPQDLGTEQ